MLEHKMTIGERMVLVARLAAAAHRQFVTNDDARRRRQRRLQRTIVIGGAGRGWIKDDLSPFTPSTGAREAETDIRSRAPRAVPQQFYREGAD